jgi:hypothetical protein
VHLSRSKYISLIGKFNAIKKLPEESQWSFKKYPRFKLYQSNDPLERLIQPVKESADCQESLFKEIVGENNPGLAIYCWNSLFFWVDFETRLLKCYDMEHKAPTIFVGSDNVDGLSLTLDIIKDEYRDDTVKYPLLNFNNNILYC